MVTKKTKEKLPPLTVNQIKAADWIQLYYHQQGLFPSSSAFNNKNPNVETLPVLLENPTFKLALANRGIHPQPRENLTSEQMAAILAVCNYADRRSHSAKLRDLGIGLEKWKGWLKNPQFKQFLHKEARQDFKDNLQLVLAGLMRAIDNGHVDAIKLYLEMTGRYTPASANEANTRLVIVKLIESIRRHVHDPIIFQRIVDDFNLTSIPSTTPITQKEILEHDSN